MVCDTVPRESPDVGSSDVDVCPLTCHSILRAELPSPDMLLGLLGNTSWDIASALVVIGNYPTLPYPRSIGTQTVLRTTMPPPLLPAPFLVPRRTLTAAQRTLRVPFQVQGDREWNDG